MRSEQEDYVTCFKYGYPGFGRIVGNSAFCGQRREVKKLAGSPGAKTDEPLKGFKFLNLEDLSYVSFNVRSGIGAEPGLRCNIPVIKRWITTAIEQAVCLCRQEVGLSQLRDRKG